MDKDAAPVLHQDLFCDAIYSYLWQPNANGQPCPGVCIPNTVIFKYYDAAQWFFTAKDGKIERKRKTHLKAVDIFEAFCDRTSTNTDIYASWTVPTYSEEDPPKRCLRIEYFDKEALHDFLFVRSREEKGILQEWIDPPEDINRCFRCNWGASMIFVESRQNLYRLDDEMRTPFERAVTYDVGEKLTKVAPMRDKAFISVLYTMCKSIRDHILANSNGLFDITRLMPTFKVDPQGTIWLLWVVKCDLANGGKPRQVANASSMDVATRAALPFGPYIATRILSGSPQPSRQGSFQAHQPVPTQGLGG